MRLSGQHRLVADRDPAAFGHLGIDAAEDVAVAGLQRAHHVQVADPRARVHVGGEATDDVVAELQQSAAEAQGRAGSEPVFAPGPPALDPDVGPEAERIDRPVHRLLQVAHAIEVQHRDEAVPAVDEAVALRRLQHSQGAVAFLRRLFLQEFGEPTGEGLPAALRGHPPVERREAIGGHRQLTRLLVVEGPRPGQLGHLHQGGELHLVDVLWRGWIEAARAVLDGIEPVAGEEPAGLQPHGVQGLRREALDRMAPEGGDAAGHDRVCAPAAGSTQGAMHGRNGLQPEVLSRRCSRVRRVRQAAARPPPPPSLQDRLAADAVAGAGRDAGPVAAARRRGHMDVPVDLARASERRAAAAGRTSRGRFRCAAGATSSGEPGTSSTRTGS